MYSMDSLKAIMNSTFNFIQENDKVNERLALDIKIVKDSVEDGISDLKKIVTKKIDDIDDKIENLDVKLFNRME